MICHSVDQIETQAGRRSPKKAVEQIAAEIKPFDAADFRAKEVRERASEPEEPDTEEEG